MNPDGFRVSFSNIKFHTKEWELTLLCTNCGKIPIVDLNINPRKGIALVCYKKKEDATAVVNALDGAIKLGRKLHVAHVRDRPCKILQIHSSDENTTRHIASKFGNHLMHSINGKLYIDYKFILDAYLSFTSDEWKSAAIDVNYCCALPKIHVTEYKQHTVDNNKRFREQDSDDEI